MYYVMWESLVKRKVMESDRNGEKQTVKESTIEISLYWLVGWHLGNSAR